MTTPAPGGGSNDRSPASSRTETAINETQLTKLRLIESELLHLQREQAQLAARTHELHRLVIELLDAELTGSRR